MKTKMIKRILPIGFVTPLACVMPLTSCGLSQTWDWLVSSKNNTEINYCLLIGQNDHTDSQKRTEGTRRALDTFDEEATKKAGGNANVANPKPNGKLTIQSAKGKSATFKVNEIEHMEQKSIGGASWDPISANATAGTWIAKHGSKITFFVSNNDSMAEGAYWASNWIKGLPIFGYDANSTTLQWINAQQITGTVDQGPSQQAAGALLMFRNMLEDRDAYWANFKPEEANGFGTEDYDPSLRGFTPDKGDHGYVDYTSFTEREETHDAKKKGQFNFFANRELLSKSTAITHEKNVTEWPKDKSIVNISFFMKEDGHAKQPTDMVDLFTNVSKTVPEKQYEICHTYSNRSEAFLVATMKPYFHEYENRLNLKYDDVEGDGTDETLVLNQISARENPYDAFFVCPAKTTSGLQYVLDIAKKAQAIEEKKCPKKKAYLSQKYGHEWKWDTDPNWHGWDNFEERLDTPLIFWIREPTKIDGSVDYDILFNKYFKYTYYVGSDSTHAGKIQGQLITESIKRWYSDSVDTK